MDSRRLQSRRPIDGKATMIQAASSNPVVTESTGIKQLGMTSHVSHDPVSNPLALLVAASGAIQSESISDTPLSNVEPTDAGPSPSLTSIGDKFLDRPGYVSLGIQLSRESLQSGLDALFAAPTSNHRYTDYFCPPDDGPPRDVGPDLDPVELGLVSMEEAHHLFPIYFMRLHPVNGILDPKLHTPEYVRSQSALLFTWILALTAQFDHGSAAIAKRLRLHGEKLSRHVHTSGFQSVEIVQGYYISLLSATPARTLSEERSWLYTMHAFGVAAELGLDQPSYTHTIDDNYTLTCTPRAPTDHDIEAQTHLERLVRNRERTWLRILLWERANSGASGRMNVIPETDLTRNIERWWMHPLADSTDKHTVAFILLRGHLAFLHAELQRQKTILQADPHWVRDLIDATLEPWRKTWIYTIAPSSEPLPDVHLHHVYLHNRLWTLSFALQAAIGNNHDLNAIREDCFQAAVHCCEVAVRDLERVGEPLYCMLAPTWAMISYAAILALKLFPCLHDPRPGCEIELLALLAQVALQLKHAGTTPSHRFGIAAIFGQQLLIILRTRAAGLASTTPVADTYHDVNDSGVRSGSYPLPGERSLKANGTTGVSPDTHIQDPLVSPYDPYLTTPTMGMDSDLISGGFADLFREIFGPSFGEVF
ncbi:hypothetical protein BDV38DRAFT_268136 [Aspergillus pseudotamarii]|uniref:Transcription factor domain-containing protein n=1 Tax=Aspergillus pseudotamarii TaxID=132259 RepID=A0A5N6T682_ASPPS|nr:uncharacterized protein BDV38DRAFT_268136 [Aspergillus pseudotamarii]KAE8141844.1 hypothetical protein BDV38DRAFT_268136 [Aspergillus pseudotamarii]